MSSPGQRSDRLPTGRRDPDGHRGWHASALWLLAAAVLIWLVLVGVGHLLGHQWKDSALVRWDASVDRNLAAHRHQPWTELTHLFTFLAETMTVIGVGLVAFVLLRVGLKRWREPLFLAVSLIGEVTIFVATTLLVDRDRPPVKHLDSAPPTSSFPSGHTAASVALYGGLAVIAWRVGAAAWLRTLATVAAVAVPVVVALSRMYRGNALPDRRDGRCAAGLLLAGGDQRGDPGSADLDVSRVAAVLNPIKVSDLTALKADIAARCDGLQPDWYETTEDDPGAGQAAAAVETGAQLVLVCGGDGTS